MVSRNILESYGQICGFVVEGLRKLGMRAEFKPINDIIVNNKKISGNAQTRREGVILQHGTILLDVDVKRMFSLLKVPDEKIRDKLISTAGDRVTSVSRELNPTVGFNDVKEALIKAFEKRLGALRAGGLSKEETRNAHRLFKERYSTREWNFMR